MLPQRYSFLFETGSLYENFSFFKRNIRYCHTDMYSMISDGHKHSPQNNTRELPAAGSSLGQPIYFTY